MKNAKKITPSLQIPSEKIREHFKKINTIPPNDLHYALLTKFYKTLTAKLKVMPFLYIIPFSIAISFVMYFLVGELIVYLASLLQNGF